MKMKTLPDAYPGRDGVAEGWEGKAPAAFPGTHPEWSMSRSGVLSGLASLGFLVFLCTLLLFGLIGEG